MALTMVIDADAVIQRLSLKDIEEVRNAVDSALTATHALVQGLLCTTFEKTVHSDVFFLQGTRFPEQQHGLMCLRLSQAFVQSGSVIVTANATSRKLLNSEPSAVPAEDFTIDLVRGYVMIENTYADQWIKVAYTAGFDNTHKAPDWLQEATLAYIPHMLAEPAGTFNSAAMNAATNAQSMDFKVTAKIVEPYLRNRSFQFVPLSS